MRHLRCFLLLGSLVALAGQAQAQNTIPTPPPATPTLSQTQTQTYSSCMIGCSNQNVTCSSPCVNAVSGVLVQSVGGTTSQSQCFLNCGTQQQTCQAGCRNLRN